MIWHQLSTLFHLDQRDDKLWSSQMIWQIMTSHISSVFSRKSNHNWMKNHRVKNDSCFRFIQLIFLGKKTGHRYTADIIRHSLWISFFHSFFILCSDFTGVCYQGCITWYNNWSALVQAMAWCQTGDKPSPESVLTKYTDACMWP